MRKLNLSEEELEIRKENRKKYMREYKRRQYAKNPEKVKMQTKIYYQYHKHNDLIQLADLKTYSDTHSMLEMTKIICNLEIVKKDNPELVKKFLHNYLGKMEEQPEKNLLMY